MRKARAFTLVELLVVIAIIALLMSILMPALARVRNQAKNVLCQSNLRQWGNCFAMYCDDFDGKLMRGWNDGSALFPPTHTDYWMEALRPYYGNAHDLRCCPSATKTQTNPDGSLGPGYGDGTFGAWGVFASPDICGEPSSWWDVVTACDYGSFGMNAWLCDPPRDAPRFESHDVARNNWRTCTIRGAAKVPLMGDEGWIDCWPDSKDFVPEYSGEPWGQYSDNSHMVRICLNRHNGYVNWVFMDYSVRPVGLKELWILNWHRNIDFDLKPTNEEFDSAGDGWMRPFKDYW
ncbi:MAG: prepilin-type N-terminal cleavage/methylation domain-containing protein [Planctomycetota bacterium]|nr:MAG: prepilin-type N-terminal cleavage/methylation domain-containing protein [Planctomycetota bacterium]